jgi:hypothetical protein
MFWRRGYGWISGRWRVLKLAAESREAAPGKGARCSPTVMLRSSRPKEGQHDTNREEDCRDGRSCVVRRQLSSGLAGARKLCAKGFAIMSVPPLPAFLDPAMVTTPYPTVTIYGDAHMILESASPGQRGGSHSKQGCSTDVRSVGGGYGHYLTF